MRAQFVISAAAPEQFPAAGAPEIVFAGRSNVGKSSLINDLTGHNGLARASKTPGRTRLINWFAVTPKPTMPLQFVDLPGYGYAAVPLDMRASWQPLIEALLEGTRPIALVLVLIDMRRGLGEEEQDFLDWLAERKLASHVVLTKADKLSKSERGVVTAQLRRQLGGGVGVTAFSTLDQFGRDELWSAIFRAASPRRAS